MIRSAAALLRHGCFSRAFVLSPLVLDSKFLRTIALSRVDTLANVIDIQMLVSVLAEKREERTPISGVMLARDAALSAMDTKVKRHCQTP